jgi:hypothetical protein
VKWLNTRETVTNWTLFIRSEVLTAVVTNVAIFWDIASSSPYVDRRIGGPYLQGRKSAEQGTSWFSTLKMEVIGSSKTSVYVGLHGAISQKTNIYLSFFLSVIKRMAFTSTYFSGSSVYVDMMQELFVPVLNTRVAMACCCKKTDHCHISSRKWWISGMSSFQINNLTSAGLSLGHLVLLNLLLATLQFGGTSTPCTRYCQVARSQTFLGRKSCSCCCHLPLSQQQADSKLVQIYHLPPLSLFLSPHL